MKRSLQIFTFFLLLTGARAQNLVLNPSFETLTTGCATAGYGNIANWRNPDPTDTCSTPDLFATCSLIPLTSILGAQAPRTGQAFAGFIAVELPDQGYREYIQGRLSAPLTAGQTYCVRFYVSLADQVPFACNRIGVYLSGNAVSFPVSHCTTLAPLPFTPQLQGPSAAITDKINWVKLEWSYTAAGGEQYFTIGNFFNPANTTTVNAGGGGINPFAYYYVDDVSVEPGVCCDLSVTPPASVCTTDPAFTLLPGTPGGTWSGTGITNTSTGLFNPATAGPGIHTIHYTLPCGSGTVTVTVNACINLDVCTDPSGNLTVTNGTGPYVWESQTSGQNCSACLFGCVFPPGCAVTSTTWAPLGNTPTIPMPATWPVRLTDHAGNTVIITGAASVPPCANCPTITLTADHTASVTCFGGNDGAATVSASGGNGGYTYVWMPGGLSGASQQHLAAGVYTVTATDANHCPGTLTVVINQPTALAVQTSAQPADCGQTNGSATATATGGTTPYTYAWSPSGGTNATASQLGAGNYTVTVTDFKGCTQTATSVVTNPGGPQVSITGLTHISCAGGSNGSIQIGISQGQAPYDIVWSPAGGQATVADHLPAGTYTATVTDASGCVATQTATLTEAPAMVLGVAALPANCGFADGNAAVAVSGGTSPYTYQWTPSGGSSALASGLAPGDYTVAVTDFANCTETATVHVDVAVTDSTLQLTAQVTSESCVKNDGAVAVTVSGGLPPYTYTWGGGITGTGPSAAGLTAGTYTVTVTDQCYSITEQVSVAEAFVIPSQSLPNIVTPNKDNVNDILSVGNQFESASDFYCIIYNRWGVPIYKTENKAIGWAPKNVPDGTYFIVVGYTDCAGSKEKISSTVTISDSRD